jgi:hypothetical protein
MEEDGTTRPPIPQERASGGFLHKYFPPIVAEEISERIKRIRNKTAAGLESLEKKHLLITGLPKVLALLYDILCYTSHYPESWRENRITLIPKPNQDLDKAEN